MLIIPVTSNTPSLSRLLYVSESDMADELIAIDEY
jgi:hypothetical protein